VYFPVTQACDEPSSDTPISQSQIANQDQFVNMMGNKFLGGNQSVYDLVLALGGNLPGLVPGAPATPAAVAAPSTSSTSGVPTSGAGGTSAAPATGAAPAYSAPGVLAAPTGPLAVPPQFVGGVPNPKGVDLGPAVSSMVVGCNVPWAGPSLGAQSKVPGASAGLSPMWLIGGLALAAALWWLGSEGAYNS
jgi:hypothetical protein